MRFREKGGKGRPIPVRHNLEQWLREYARAAGITDEQKGVPLEDVQHLCGHSDPRTTRIYDRRTKRVGRNLVERIPG